MRALFLFKKNYLKNKYLFFKYYFFERILKCLYKFKKKISLKRTNIKVQKLYKTIL